MVSLQNWLANTFKPRKTTISSTFLSENVTVVNRELSSLHGGSLKITLTVKKNITIVLYTITALPGD